MGHQLQAPPVLLAALATAGVHAMPCATDASKSPDRSGLLQTWPEYWSQPPIDKHKLMFTIMTLQALACALGVLLTRVSGSGN